MARIFITGSTDGLGRAAARAPIDEGHAVVLHARSRERASAVDDLAPQSAGVVIGDLSSAAETRSIADQVDAIGRMDAIIHNAGTYSTRGRSPTPEGHTTILAVNILAPYNFAVARHWPDVVSSAVDPGWVATRMGGAGAPDDFEMGYLTQTWLATSDDPAIISGRYWHHRRPQAPARDVSDARFQDRLSIKLAELTGVSLF
jgi:hypothetical protein